MATEADLFTKFGGVRPMARKLGFANPGRVQHWKKNRSVSRAAQDLVLRRAAELGIDVTAEEVIYPFPEDRGAR